VTGGGSNSWDWVQILADILQMDINILSTSDGPALGAAFLAKAGYENKPISDITKGLINVVKTIKHNDDYKEIYLEKYRRYKELYENNKKLFR
jgi:xylulokinase